MKKKFVIIIIIGLILMIFISIYIAKIIVKKIEYNDKDCSIGTINCYKSHIDENEIQNDYPNKIP